MASISDNRRLSIDFSAEKVCEDCNKARSNGNNFIENQESFDYMKTSKETLVKLPFPPGIDPKDLVNDLLNSKAQSPKMLNEFFIYRKVYVREIRKQNLRLKMTKVSKLASSSWYQEPSKVKNEYRRIAREVENEYIFARNEKLRSQKAKDQHNDKHFTNSAPANSSTLVNFDVTSNGNSNNKIEPFTPIVVKQCTPLEPSIPSINANAWLYNATYVPSIFTFNPYTPSVYMPVVKKPKPKKHQVKPNVPTKPNELATVIEHPIDINSDKSTIYSPSSPYLPYEYFYPIVYEPPYVNFYSEQVSLLGDIGNFNYGFGNEHLF
ncbi:16666_t:CDS:2, partial [Dentiscutata heterogama]